VITLRPFSYTFEEQVRQLPLAEVVLENLSEPLLPNLPLG